MAYRIEQTGVELQGILNDAAVTKQGLEDEVARAQAAEGGLQENIDSEAGERQSADALLAGNIGTEVARAQQAESDLGARVDANTAGVAAEVARAQEAEGQVWDTLNDEILTRQSQDAALQGNIERESILRENGDGQLQGEIDGINMKVPVEASGMNQLADKLFVQDVTDGKADKADSLAGYGIEDAYTKDAVDEMVGALSRNEIIVGPLPQTGDEGVIYRVPGNGYYTDYMYYDGSFKELAQYSMEFDQTQVGYFSCDTAAGTAAKTVSAAGYTLAVGGNMRIKMTNANTAENVTLNINSRGAKALYFYGKQASPTNSWDAGDVLKIYYDGERFVAERNGVKEELVVAKALCEHDDKISRQGEKIGEIEDLVDEMGQSVDSKMGEDEELVLANALIYLKSKLSGAGLVSGEVTVANSDVITIYGSSYGIASYALAGKHAIDIMDMLSDYRWQNISQDGSSKYTQLQNIRSQTSRFAPAGKYVILYNNENNGDCNVYDRLQSTKLFADTMRSFGAEPVIGTGYNSGDALTSLYRRYCMDNGYLFANSQSYYKLIAASKTGQNTHLNTRQLPVVAYAYMDALRCMERPKQSLKYYVLRPGQSTSSLDDLLFNDSYGRSKRFVLSSFGVQSDYALISCVLPATEKDLTSVILKLTTSDDVTVYCRNTLASPYPAMSTYTRFLVDAEIAVPSQGSVYSFGGSNYTVVSVVVGGYAAYCDIYCSPNGGSASGAGTLTKVSGDGPSTIAIVGAEPSSALSQKAAVLSDTNGHWVEIDGSDGEYMLSSLDGRVDYDTIHFLVVGSNFAISNASVAYKALSLKNYRRLPQVEFDSNYYSAETELVSEPTFGEAGSTTSWHDDGGNSLVSVAPSTEKAPMGCDSVILVSNAVAANITIPSSSLSGNGKAILEVWARYSGYDSNNNDLVTTSSWDFNELRVGWGDYTTTGYAQFTDQVGLAWKICRFELDVYPLNTTSAMPIRISAERYGMEIAKVSLKMR